MTIKTDPVPLRVEPEGTLRVGDTRVTLDVVINCFKQGNAAETIPDQDLLEWAARSNGSLLRTIARQ